MSVAAGSIKNLVFEIMSEIIYYIALLTMSEILFVVTFICNAFVPRVFVYRKMVTAVIVMHRQPMSLGSC